MKDNINGLMEMFIMVNLWMTNGKVEDSTNGITPKLIRASGVKTECTVSVR